jgi:hypothetical protein
MHPKTKVKMGFEHLHRRKDPRPRLRPLTTEERACRLAHAARYQYRVMVFARPVTDWMSLADAQRTAIRMGHGSRCQFTRRLFMTVPAWIQERETPVDARPRHEPCCSTPPAP